MSESVLDSSALIAYLEDEPGSDEIGNRFFLPEPIYIHGLNLIEVHYHFIRSRGEEAANEFLAEISASSLIVREDMDESIRDEVARLKAKGRISLADCFCISLARRVGGEVVTADHHEFDALVPVGLCPIRFIR
jgi:PIN domain nuclease of toxin-antitoxin system